MTVPAVASAAGTGASRGRATNARSESNSEHLSSRRDETAGLKKRGRGLASPRHVAGATSSAGPRASTSLFLIAAMYLALAGHTMTVTVRCVTELG